MSREWGGKVGIVSIVGTVGRKFITPTHFLFASITYLTYFTYNTYLTFRPKNYFASVIFSLFTYHCCAMPKRVETAQYKDTAAGKRRAKKPIMNGRT